MLPVVPGMSKLTIRSQATTASTSDDAKRQGTPVFQASPSAAAATAAPNPATTVGSIQFPSGWPAGTTNVWNYLLGPRMQPDDPWNGITLLKRVIDSGRVSLDNFARPGPAWTSFWGHDIDRSRLPKITPASRGILLPSAPGRRRHVVNQLEVITWLYKTDRPDKLYGPIRLYSKEMHDIIIELGKIPALQNQLQSFQARKRVRTHSRLYCPADRDYDDDDDGEDGGDGGDDGRGGDYDDDGQVRHGSRLKRVRTADVLRSLDIKV
ncbi:unnamed protein product [Parajaminaea phylloscopi]